MTGRTGALGVHTGDLVRANDTTPMVVINQVSPIYVTFSVPGRYVGDIRRYQAQKPLVVKTQGQSPLPPGAQAPPPQVLTPSLAKEISPGQGATAPVPAGIVETGRVSFIDNSVDASTGTIKLKGTFDNTDQGLWPGLFVQVTLHLTTDQNAIVVPGGRRAAVGLRPVRLRGAAGSHRRSSSRDGRASAGRGNDHCQGPVRRRRSGDRRAAPTDPGRTGQHRRAARRRRRQPRRGERDRRAAARLERPRTQEQRTMNVAELFIRRPVATTLLVLTILIFGIMGYTQLPVADLPTVDYPTIQVNANLPGANPDTMASSVATPLEKQFSTISGITSISSRSSQGSTNISLTFDLDRSSTPPRRTSRR